MSDGIPKWHYQVLPSERSHGYVCRIDGETVACFGPFETPRHELRQGIGDLIKKMWGWTL